MDPPLEFPVIAISARGTIMAGSNKSPTRETLAVHIVNIREVSA